MANQCLWRGAITGLSYGAYGRFIESLRTGVVLDLKHDPDNQYDDTAVGVYFQGAQLGWIPKGQNAPLFNLLEDGQELISVITNHDKQGDFSKRLFINVFLKRDAPDNGASGLNIRRTTSSSSSKETTMIDKLVEINKLSAISAAFMEGGRMANDQLGKVASKKLPVMARCYAQTAVGRLVMANLAQMAASQFRPQNRRLAQLTEAMVTEAYTQVIREFDLDGMINELLKSAPMQKALAVIEEDAAS